MFVIGFIDLPVNVNTSLFTTTPGFRLAVFFLKHADGRIMQQSTDYLTFFFKDINVCVTAHPGLPCRVFHCSFQRQPC